MTINQILKFTPVAKAGMTIKEFFDCCVEYDVPGIPFVDQENKVIGRVSLRHVTKINFIPDHASHVAHLFSDDHNPNLLKDDHVDTCLNLPVDNFILTDVVELSKVAPVFQVLAKMEKFNTAYLFVMEDGQYQGIITRRDVIRSLLNNSENRTAAAIDK